MRGFNYSLHAPPLPLAGLVDYFWSLSDVPLHSRERVIPSGTLELVVNLHEDEFRVERPTRVGQEPTRLRGAIVSGAYSGSFVVETRAHASIVGVHFKPGGGATTLLGVPSGALGNVHVELEALWGGRAVELRERLCLAADSAQRFRILEQVLSSRLSGSPGVRGEIAIALGRLGAPRVKVSDVVRQVQLSHRRFNELFTEQVGMTPKRYSRVRRFQGALEWATDQSSLAWAEVALEYGYVDQAHLCRDWVEFTGLSPVDFLHLRSVRVKDNHVALPEPPRSTFSRHSRPACAPCARTEDGMLRGMFELGTMVACIALGVAGGIADGGSRMSDSGSAGSAPFSADAKAAVVRYQVLDVDRAIAFYTERLGFHLDQRSGAVFATVSRGDLHLLLSGPGSSGSRPMPDGRRPGTRAAGTGSCSTWRTSTR